MEELEGREGFLWGVVLLFLQVLSVGLGYISGAQWELLTNVLRLKVY